MFIFYFFGEMIKFNIFIIKLIIFIVNAVFKFRIILTVAILNFIHEELYNFILTFILCLFFYLIKKAIEAKKQNTNNVMFKKYL